MIDILRGLIREMEAAGDMPRLAACRDLLERLRAAPPLAPAAGGE